MRTQIAGRLPGHAKRCVVWRAGILVAFALLLSGCGPSTPLTHAIAALRAGDQADFDKAKAEAAAAVQGAWQQGADVCKLSAADFQKYGEAALIEKLDHPDLFKLSEQARFVYVAKITGKLDAAMAEISDQPIVQNWMHPPPGTSCEMAQQTAAFPGGGDAPPGEDERRTALKDWMDHLTDQAGDKSAFDAGMQAAVG